ncbi:MAG: tricarballylate utilization 4Fe-4S protein TcuB [Comamonadaceae bacterium]
MQALENLTREARALADGTSLSVHEAEVGRQMQICNACRYCEGFCAVFPAMTRRLEFGKADVHYLANLCHNCGACLHACQYAPPHEFAVNVPQAMAKVRLQTYADYAWPAALGSLYRRNGLTLALVLAAALALFMMLVLGGSGSSGQATAASGFYAILPHGLLVSLFAPVFLFAVLALGLGLRRFWREIRPASLSDPDASAMSGVAVREASRNALSLKYLDGGHGEGCNNHDDGWTLWRRRFHHLTAYGFVLCFAATSVATLYHYLLAWDAPYDLPSLPKLLGVIGGVSLLIGSAGLFALNLRRHPLHGDAAQKPMDRGFIALLFFSSASGLALWLARSSAAMPLLLAFHLGVVMALFLTLPYGKFAHGLFRGAALLKWSIERRQPDRLKLGSD